MQRKQDNWLYWGSFCLLGAQKPKVRKQHNEEPKPKPVSSSGQGDVFPSLFILCKLRKNPPGTQQTEKKQTQPFHPAREGGDESYNPFCLPSRAT